MISGLWRHWVHNWLKRRIPRQPSHQLKHSSIFILPSTTGLAFVVLLLLLWLVGTNYQNNLVLATAFLLLSLMVICIHHTYANLSGLTFSVVDTSPGFAGSEGRVQVRVKAPAGKTYEQVCCHWPDQSPVYFSLINDQQVTLSLPVELAYRGWFQPPRLKIMTAYPLGLMTGWSYLDLDAPVLTWPQPIPANVQPETQALDDADQLQQQALARGHEEFAGLREYQPGDSLRMIDWRALARGQGLASRQYDDYVSQHYWLDWHQFDGLSREARLSRLCACVLEQSHQTHDYGLKLPGLVIEPGQGERHQQQLLKALALFELESDVD